MARVRAGRSPDGTAYERFGPDGPSALLPRGDRHYGLVHTVPRTQAESVMALESPAFLRRAQDALGWRVGRLLECGPRSAYPAVRSVARSLTAPRAVLVGNAAQTVHPIGAQGFNLGLRDALTLAELVRDARDAGTAVDCGDPALLERYALRRQEDRTRTLDFSDGLVRVTSRESSLLRPLRVLGLLAADLMPSLQAQLVGGAMGYRGDVPELCRRVP